MRRFGLFSLEILVSLVLNVTASLFNKPQAITFSKWGWLLVLAHATYLVLSSEGGKRYAVRFRALFGRRRVLFHAVVGLSFAILVGGYWTGINVSYSKLFYAQSHSVLPGMSVHMIIRLKSLPVDRRKYIVDFGSSQTGRLSVYITSDSIVTLSFLDIKGEPHAIQLPLGGDGVPLAEFFYLGCEIGIDGQSTRLYVIVNGTDRGSLQLPFRVDVSSLNVPGGVVGADLDGKNGGSFDLKEFLVYPSTLDDKGLNQTRNYFKRRNDTVTDYVEFKGEQWMRVNQVGKHDLTQKDESHAPIFRN